MNWCPYKKRRDTQTNTERAPCEKAEGGVMRLQDKEH